MSEPELSVVIPLRDEEANVVPLHAELSSVLQSMRRPYEAILVEDIHRLGLPQAAGSRHRDASTIQLVACSFDFSHPIAQVAAEGNVGFLLAGLATSAAA